MNITVLALEGVFDTGLSTVLDAFTTANELSAMQGLAAAPFNVTLAAVRAEVRSAQGMLLPVTLAGPAGSGAAMAAAVVPGATAGAAAPTAVIAGASDAAAAPGRGARLARPDVVVIPALGQKMPEPLQAALGRDDVIDAVALLRAWAADGVRIAAACIGTFVLAETGLLDNHDATTTWWLTPMFRQRYPAVQLDSARMVVSSGQFVTAGAALSHLDMALLLIRQSSPELAALVANYLIVDTRPSQSAYVITDHLAHADPLVARFDRWARENLGAGFSLDAAASALATSKRTLARRLQEVIGKSPVNYVQDLRIERAVHLLKTSDQNIDRIAEQVGYSDGTTLRTLLRRKLGKGLREIRA